MTPIWSYWEGPRLPYIEQCLKSVARVCGDNYCLVTPNTVKDYLSTGTLNPAYRRLAQPALKADCIRAALLARYGGWWWDADTLGFKSPVEFTAAQPPGTQAIYATWTKPPRRIMNGYLYLAPGCPIGVQWLAAVNVALAGDLQNIDWCSLGEKLLTPLVTECPGAIEIERRLLLPIDIDSDVECFFKPGDPARLIKPDTLCFGLNHSYFVYHHLKAMQLPIGRWVRSPLLIHQLLERTRCK